MKRYAYLPLAFVLGFATQRANAQSEFNVAVGFGAAQAPASGAGVEGDPNSANIFGSCTPGSTVTCSPSNALSGLMMGFRGSLFLWKHFGVGADISFQPGKQDYVSFPSSAIQAGGANLQSRTMFYDVDAIVKLIRTKHADLELLGGIGGANMRFYTAASLNNGILGTQNFSQYYGSANHFQEHAGVGVDFLVTKHIFVRPQFDLHYVNNFSQFGRNAVTEESVAVGYRWGTE